jgi:hypothetical protein
MQSGCSSWLLGIARVILYGCFVDKHDWNVVAYWINPAAFHALQPAAVGLQFDLRLAFGAGEYFQ